MQILSARAGSIVSAVQKNRRISRLVPLATPLLLAVAGLANAQENVAVHLDNDLFSGSGRDSDYSWGATVTFGSSKSRATQLGIIAMTPDDLDTVQAQPDDRPYASLVFLTSSKLRIDSSGDRSRFNSFTVGLLGTGVAEGIQRAVHDVQGGVVPNGWSHQVSDGGELTARYVHAEQWLVGDGEARSGGLRQTKMTLAGSAGYLTEASAAISMRWGRIYTPWWSFNPELGDYSSAPIAPVNDSSFGGSPEVYGFVGARVKARAYNALLQGQFRHSDVRVASDDLARFQVEAWAGVTSAFSEWRVTYSIHAASREMTPKPAARTLVWASVSFARAF